MTLASHAIAPPTWRTSLQAWLLVVLPALFLLGASFPHSLLAQETSNAVKPENRPASSPNDFQAMTATAAAFRQAAEKIRPTLVTIESYGGGGTHQGKIGGIRKQGEGNSTGVMISPDGYVLTSTFNFIESPLLIAVIPHDGKRRLARLIGRDDTRKICLLKIDGVENMPVPEMVPVDQIQVGQWAVSLGIGYGDATPALSQGIISAKNRIGGRAIQTDANISPANYGGPLIDIEGRMLGICVPMNPQSQAIGAGVEWYDSGIGFAIPIAGAEASIDRMKQGEHIRPAFLGIQAVSNPRGKGLAVKKVVKGAPAEQAKIAEGDIILKINGTPITDLLQFRQQLSRFESGQEIKLTILKKGKKKATEIPLKLGTAPKPPGEANQLEPPKIH